jgi:hypothetical protein
MKNCPWMTLQHNNARQFASLRISKQVTINEYLIAIYKLPNPLQSTNRPNERNHPKSHLFFNWYYTNYIIIWFLIEIYIF